jgi:hypothetical protein
MSFKPVMHLQEFNISIRFVILCMKQPVLDSLLLMDEARFHLSGYSNNQNGRIWSAENPRALHGSLLHLSKIFVWCAVS